MALDPTDQIIICAGLNEGFGFPSGIYKISIASGSAYNATDITSSTTGCSALYSNTNPGLKWDTHLGVFTSYPGTGNVITYFNYNTLTCTAHTFANGPTEPAYPIPSGTYDRYAYFPSLNLYLVANNALGPMFTLSLATPVPTGLGHSTYLCVDFDGDGYGAGLIATINTTLSSSASAGATTIQVASASGITTGTVLRLDFTTSMELVQVTGISGTTLTLQKPLAFSHSSSASLTDLNCLGPDADDNDSTVWSNAQVIKLKYGSISAFLAKLANDIIAENPWCGSVTAGACDNTLSMVSAQSKAAAAAAGL